MSPLDAAVAETDSRHVGHTTPEAVARPNPLIVAFEKASPDTKAVIVEHVREAWAEVVNVEPSGISGSERTVAIEMSLEEIAQLQQASEQVLGLRVYLAAEGYLEQVTNAAACTEIIENLKQHRRVFAVANVIRSRRLQPVTRLRRGSCRARERRSLGGRRRRTSISRDDGSSSDPAEPEPPVAVALKAVAL